MNGGGTGGALPGSFGLAVSSLGVDFGIKLSGTDGGVGDGLLGVGMVNGFGGWGELSGSGLGGSGVGVARASAGVDGA